MLKQFTCITFDNTDFLIPCDYVVSGIYLPVKDDTKFIVFNRETLPLLSIGNLLEKEFFCKAKSDVNTMIVMRIKDFEQDVCKDIFEYTETAFPQSGNLALSLVGEVKSIHLAAEDFEPIPSSIRERMCSCGICAMRFTENGRKQLLISPDLLIRKFFAGALM